MWEQGGMLVMNGDIFHVTICYPKYETGEHVGFLNTRKILGDAAVS